MDILTPPQARFQKLKNDYCQIVLAIASVQENLGSGNYATEYLKDEEHRLKTVILYHCLEYKVPTSEIDFLNL